MDNQNHKVELTSAEISSLWATYQEETLAICGIEYFLTHIDDEQIRELLKDTLMLTKRRTEKIICFFVAEEYPIPQGFTEQDVNLHAPRLFLDKLYLKYILNMTKIHIATFGLALMNAVRSDIIAFYSEVLKEAQDLHIRAKELSKEKGIYIRAPYIPKPRQIDFVKKENFLAGWIGDRRPLLGMEITSLVFNAKRNALGKQLLLDLVK